MDFKYTNYSEETYFSRIQLKNMYSGSIADLIYEEILKYRALYRHELIFTNRKYYITLNQTLYKKMIKIYELDNYVRNLTHVYCYGEDSNTCIDAFERKKNVELSPLLKTFLLSEEDFIVKLFILYYVVKDKMLWHLFLKDKNKGYWIPYIHKINIHINDYSEVLDLTYAYRIFLEEFTINLAKAKEEVKDVKIYQKEELSILFPRLGNHHISFYLTHCNMEASYTISQYQNFTHQSYEGSRLAMELLCEEGFYYKVKVGKKHRFIPNFKVIE